MDMKDRNGQNRRRKPKSDGSEIGVVRVFSRPGPDAEDRLRRLFTLLVRYATQDEKDVPDQEDSSDDERPDDESTEAEA